MNETHKQNQSWWKRNWKWVLPVGGCVTLIIGGLFLGGIIFGFVNRVHKNSGADEVLALIQENKTAQKVLGTPIEKNGFGSYHISYIDGHKTAEVTMPIKGPEASATLFVKSSGSEAHKFMKPLKLS